MDADNGFGLMLSKIGPRCVVPGTACARVSALLVRLRQLLRTGSAAMIFNHRRQMPCCSRMAFAVSNHATVLQPTF